MSRIDVYEAPRDWVSVLDMTGAALGRGPSRPDVISISFGNCENDLYGKLAAVNGFGGQTIKLALFRIKAKDPDRRIGVLLFNPGGPGESGIAFMRSAASVVSDQLAARFDLVSWDPRGTGASDPVRCGPIFDHALDAPSPVPTTAPERASVDAVA